MKRISPISENLISPCGMNSIDNKLIQELNHHGTDFNFFVDISALTFEQNKGYPTAVFFGIALSPEFIQKVIETPDYVQYIKKNNLISEDEFNQKEKKTDAIADKIAAFIESEGYSAYSQSETNIAQTGYYNEKTKTTPLPHKMIARLAGFGWIGKHDLLINPEFGSAFSMCTVLTNAPLMTEEYTIKDSQCGDCIICKNICPENIITGKNWTTDTIREDLIDISKCKTCLMCLVSCPWTKKYAQKNIL